MRRWGRLSRDAMLLLGCVAVLGVLVVLAAEVLAYVIQRFFDDFLSSGN